MTHIKTPSLTRHPESMRVWGSKIPGVQDYASDFPNLKKDLGLQSKVVIEGSCFSSC